MDTVLADLRFAVRQLTRSPGFTVVAVLTLALGVGANSLLFSVIHAVLLRPLPYSNPDRLMSVSLVPGDKTSERMFAAQVPHWAYLEWQDESKSFSELAAYSQAGPAVAQGLAEPITGAFVTSRFFPLLGVQPALGRTFTAEEQRGGGPPVMLVSHGLWQSRFGGDSGIVGRTIVLDDAPVTIVGVLPTSFDFPSSASFWRPMFSLPTNGGKSWVTLFIRVLGRLAPGVTASQARTELNGLLPRVKYQAPFVRDAGVEVVTLHERLYGSARPLLLVLLGAVGFVLLIACANVASLLVARATRREREFAIRATLGAGRPRLVRQLLAESLVLAVLGAAAGLCVPAFGLRLLMHAAPLQSVAAVEVHIDASVLAFTTGLSLLTGVAFGLAPALAAARSNLTEGLKSGTVHAGHLPYRTRLRQGLVVAELAAALVLLTGAGLLTRSLFQLWAVDLGFQPDRLIGAYVGRLPRSWYVQGRLRKDFHDRLLQPLIALPGVASATLADALPLGAPVSTSTVRVDDAPPLDSSKQVNVNAVSAGYFNTVGAKLTAGRDFTSADRTSGALVAIVNQAFAREFLRAADPVGHRVALGRATRTIVGQIKDIRQLARDVPAAPEVFVPALQAGYTPAAIAIRTKIDPGALVETIRRKLQELDPEQHAPRVFTLEGELAKSAAPQRDSAVLLGAFAVVALALAAVGLAGVTAYLVAHRTHEIGVRVALGAGRGDVLKLVVWEGARLVFLGAAIGSIAAVALTRVLKGLLFGVTATDPLTFLVVPLLLAVIALGASMVPARRATQVDPMTALRYE
jgi:putative ABC transport system permease protein